jgi:predicted protein tyrosine phosphatase
LRWRRSGSTAFSFGPARGIHHRSILKSRFRSFLQGRRVVCLDIPDRYELIAPELVALLMARVARYLPERLA